MKLFYLVLLFAFFNKYLSCEDPRNYKFIMLDLKNDKRYIDWGIHPVDIRSKYNKQKRAVTGAKLSIKDSEKLFRLTGTKFSLEYLSLNDRKELMDFFKTDKNLKYNAVILDFPEDYIMSIIEEIRRNDNQIYFNISASSNNLRKNICVKNLLHTYPSNAMLTDSISQYLVSKKWNKVLILTGPLKEDKEYSKSFKVSAKKFGLKIIKENFFVDNNDPRIRDKNSLAFLTMEKKYNSIFIADIDGEFALKVPNSSNKSVVVTGSAGLRPLAWHWSYLRYGAPQLNGRFERMADRRMHGKDWAAYMSIKSVVEGILRIKLRDNFSLLTYIKSNNIKIDGSKGISLSFRENTGQLRQTILLVSGNNWVTQITPMDDFTNKNNDLDTLGILTNSCI